MAGLAADEWFVGLASWVLQDGNYTDFRVGELRQFAPELGYSRSARLVRTEERAPRCRHTGRGAWYDACGRVMRVPSDSRPGMDCFVVDVGIGAFATQLMLDAPEAPEGLLEAPEGSWIAGEIALGVDPFLYMDEFTKRADVPPLIRTWRVLGIERDVAPGADESVFEPVERTDAWGRELNDGFDYRLRCRLLPDPPERTMERSEGFAEGGAHGPVRTTAEVDLPGP